MAHYTDTFFVGSAVDGIILTPISSDTALDGDAAGAVEAAGGAG